jgi:peptide/nickel transport system substrate-binding protein
MKTVLRVLPLALMLVLALGFVMPVLGQDAPEGGMTMNGDLMTYSADSCDYGGEFLSIEAVDAQNVKFTLCYPDPALPSKVAFGAFAIYSSDYIESTGGTGDLVTNPIGTGPYKVDHWDLGNELVLTRNENYWGEPAVEETLIFRWNSEAAARLTELQSGGADAIDNVGPSDFEVIANDSSLQLKEREGLNVMYVGFNNTIAPFDDVRVRQAISMGIDKQRIVDNFYPPGSSVADQFMPTSIFGYTAEVEPLAYDVDAAKALVQEYADETGATVPLEVTLNYRDVVRGYLPQPGVVGQDIQAQLADIGINVTIEVMESGAFIDATNAGTVPFFLLGWGADYPDATNFLDYHFGSTSSPRFGDHFDEITEPLSQGAQLAAPEDRYPFYVEANTAIRDLVPMVPIAHGGSAVAYAGRIEGAHSSPLGNERFAIMEDPDDDNLVWMQNAEPIGLYCADESDGESLRACRQIQESLLDYETGGTAVVPALSDTYTVSDDLTEWTFHLREGVTFTDGSTLDANDVVMSYAVNWDAANPLHVGRVNQFTYWGALFGFLNPPAAEE